jgi:hypothetical protein
VQLRALEVGEKSSHNGLCIISEENNEYQSETEITHIPILLLILVIVL